MLKIIIKSNFLSTTRVHVIYKYKICSAFNKTHHIMFGPVMNY